MKISMKQISLFLVLVTVLLMPAIVVGQEQERSSALIVRGPTFSLTYLGADNLGGFKFKGHLKGFGAPPQLFVDDLQVVHNFTITNGDEEFAVPAMYLAAGHSHRLAVEGLPEKALVIVMNAPPSVSLTPQGDGFIQVTPWTIKVHPGQVVSLKWEVANPNLGTLLPIGPPIDEVTSNFGLVMSDITGRTTTGVYTFTAYTTGKVRLSARVGTASAFAELVVVVE